MYKINPNDIEIHFELPPLVPPGTIVSIDSEFFGMDENKLHRPHGTFASLACTPNGRDVYMIFEIAQIAEFYKRLNDGIHSYHNAQFDIKQLRRFIEIPDRKKIWDSMLVEQIRYRGYYSDFALNDLSRRYLNMYLPKEQQKTFEKSSRMTDEQIFYAACDVVSQWNVTGAQRYEIDDDDSFIWSNIERPFLWTLLSMNGVGLDKERWLSLANKNQTRSDEIDSILPFNPRSHVQIKDFFKKNFKKTLKSTDEDTLKELMQKEASVDFDKDRIENPNRAKHLLEDKKIDDLFSLCYLILLGREAKKAASTYGHEFVNKYYEFDGKVYPSYHQIGAETGRQSSSHPNIQNIPHSNEFRECFISMPGKKLVIADYSSQEPRILCALSGDKNLQEVFNTGKDIYIEAGFRVFGERFDKKDERRKFMKDIILGIPYGMSEVGLADRMGLKRSEASTLLGKFFEEFPGVGDYLDRQSKATDKVTTMYGRKIWLNPYTNQHYRNALNAPIQGSAADCTKIASNKIYETWGVNPMVLSVHDEIGIEVDEMVVDEGERIMRECMISTAEEMHPGVPSAVEVYIGDNWAEKGKKK